MLTFTLSASDATKQELEFALSELFGQNAFEVTENTPVASITDEDLGFSPLVESYLVGVSSGIISNLLTDLIRKHIANMRSQAKNDEQDSSSTPPDKES